MPKKQRKKYFLELLKDNFPNPFAIQEGRFRFGQLRDSVYYSDWTEESFLSEKNSSSKEIVTKSFNFSKINQFILIAFLAIMILVGRAFWLQIMQGEHYYALSEHNRLRLEIIEPKRGIIYDRNFQPLVRNKANFVLYFRPIDLPRDELKRDELIREISAILEGKEHDSLKYELSLDENKKFDIISDSEYFYQMKNILANVKIGSLESYQPLFVKDNIDYESAMQIHLHLSKWPGVFLTTKIRREYLMSGVSGPEIAQNSSLSHILGYTGKINSQELSRLGAKYSLIDYVGKSGLEYFWEQELRGETGRKNIEVDALGRHKKIISETPAQDGFNILLSLDLDLQKKTEEVLKSHLEKHKLNRGSVIVINPNNGDVLSMVSWPAYDNNAFARGITQAEYSELLENPNLPLFNRAISGEFPSGSTIKPLFAAGALQEGIINERTTFLSTGGIRIGQWFFPDWLGGGHGLTDVRRAIAFSVNTFFYYIGGGYGDFTGLGLNGLVKYARLFGLGEQTGVDLPGEAKGFVPTQAWKEQVKKEPWYIGDTYHVSIGQGDVLVTPLQVATYTAALANGGTLFSPRLASKILNSSNEVVEEIQPKIIHQNFIDKYNFDIIRDGMRQTITIGSGRYLNSLPFTSAGKTSTAQWSSRNNTHAWFIAFAPYEKPEIAITVLLEEGGEGSAVAVPVAYEVLDWYFKNKD